MLRQVDPDNSPATPAPPTASAPSAWWARLLACVPMGALYALASAIGFLTYRVFPHREHVVRENLTKAFPDFDETRLREVIRQYYLGFAQVLVEVIKSVSMPPEEFQRRVRIVNLEAPRAHLAAGRPVLLVAAHQCNWEWMLLALSLELGYPVDAAYKPLIDNWAEREMKKLRTRFGSRLIPAKDLLPDIIRRRGVVRAVAMVADQEPTTSENKHWTRFLNRDTAFFMGAEEIARVTRFPAFFIGMRRVARGYYEMSIEPFPDFGPSPPAGTLTEAYARRVEAQIRAAPPDWPWSHKRWKLKRSLYQSRASAAPR